MKRLSKLVFSRVFFTALFILFEIAWLLSLIFDVSARFNSAYEIFFVFAIVLVFMINSKWSHPSYKLAWSITILIVPFVGIPLYFLFGRSDLTKRQRIRMDRVHERVVPLLQQDEDVAKELENIDDSAYMQSKYLTRASGYPLYRNADSTYFPSGEAMFESMLADIRNAKKFVFIEYFILEKGFMYNSLVELLYEKVKEGVEVRLIYDDVGCITKMPTHFYKELQAHGIKVAAFHPFKPVLSIIMNNRDHRKIVVIDGKIGYTGGVNIADEYINRTAPFGHWKDTGIRICGPAVWNFTAMFLENWDYMVGGSSSYDKYAYPIEESDCGNRYNGFVQPYGDSPLDHENVGENVYLNMINRAKKYIYIFTPYLILDQELQVALCNAAKAGVDVRIVTPGIPDKKMVYMLTRANYSILEENGVRIYEYTPGFLHAKNFICDDEIATVGSINLDYRSLYLHFECGLWLYGADTIQAIKEDMLKTIEASLEVTDKRQNPYRKRITLRDVGKGMLRLMAPLL